MNNNYKQLASEYYFDYQINKIEDNIGLNSECIKIYIEKIISPKITGGFQTFIVIQDWLEPKENVELFKNLHRLELVAEQYSKGTKNTDWLVFLYLRQFNYSGTLYDTVTGNDSGFVGYVEE